MKQATITTQVIHTMEFDERATTPQELAELVRLHVQGVLTVELPQPSHIELEVFGDPNPVVVDI